MRRWWHRNYTAWIHSLASQLEHQTSFSYAAENDMISRHLLAIVWETFQATLWQNPTTYRHLLRHRTRPHYCLPKHDSAPLPFKQRRTFYCYTHALSEYSVNPPVSSPYSTIVCQDKPSRFLNHILLTSQHSSSTKTHKWPTGMKRYGTSFS